MFKKIILPLFFLVLVVSGYSQEENIDYVTKKEYSDVIFEINRYNYLEKIRLNKEINKTKNIQSNINLLNVKIDSLSGLLILTVETNCKLSDSLAMAVNTLVQVKNETRSDIEKVNNMVSSRTNYWMMGLGIVIFLVIVTLLVLSNRYNKTINSFSEQFVQFKKEINSDLNQHRFNLDTSLSNLEESLTKQNNQTKKLVLLNDFMQTLPLNQRPGNNGNKPAYINKLAKKDNGGNNKGGKSNGQIDHTLSLKLANELNEIKHHLSNLPIDTAGIIVLKEKYAKVESILNDVGYELVELQGIAVTDDLQKQAELIVPEGIDADNKIVSKVIIPQINYKGDVIQTATVEVKPA